jgi:hypothetical protein
MVEVNINPFTYKLIKKHRNKFIDDSMIQCLLDNTEYLGQADGYLSVSFQGRFSSDNDVKAMAETREALQETKRAVIKMHQYVIAMISKDPFIIKRKKLD